MLHRCPKSTASAVSRLASHPPLKTILAKPPRFMLSYLMQAGQPAITPLLCLALLITLCACSRPTQTGWLEQHVSDTNALALVPVTSSEDSVLVYAVPLSIDVRSNSYDISLVDNGKVSTSGYELTWQTNGGYLLQWDTVFASFGPHALQVTICGPGRKQIPGLYGPRPSPTWSASTRSPLPLAQRSGFMGLWRCAQPITGSSCTT
jgi:hypothetical protein